MIYFPYFWVSFSVCVCVCSVCVCVSAVLFKDRPFPINKHHFSTRPRRPLLVFDTVAQKRSDVGRKWQQINKRSRQVIKTSGLSDCDPLPSQNSIKII